MRELRRVPRPVRLRGEGTEKGGENGKDGEASGARPPGGGVGVAEGASGAPGAGRGTARRQALSQGGRRGRGEESLRGWPGTLWLL